VVTTSTLTQQLAEPIVYILALAITAVSGTLVYRLRLTAYQMVRSAVLGVYGLIVILMLIDLVRDTVGTSAYIMYYAPLSTLLGVMQAILLLAAAQGIYLSPSLTIRRYLGEVQKHRGHFAVLLLFVVMAVAATVYEVLGAPYSSGIATDFAGNSVAAMMVDVRLPALVYGLLFVFLVYPAALLLAGAAKVEDQKLRRSIFGVVGGWSAVSVLYVISATSIWLYGFDFAGVMYLANAVIFYVALRNFRRSAAFAGVTLPLRGAPSGTGTVQPARTLTALTQSLEGKKVLYEVDPAVPYETTLGQTLEELAWADHAVFVITPKGSPLRGALSGGTGLKFFLTAGDVSYMKVVEDTPDVLIPESDTAIFLEVIDKTLASRKGKAVLVLDSISGLLVLIGIERTYKFLKHVVELTSDERVTALFIFLKRAHESRDENLLRALFATHFLEDADGARLVR
jgi:hypothetical protein